MSKEKYDQDGALLPHFDIAVQKKEYQRIFSALEEGKPVPSLCWVYADTGGGNWTIDCLTELLKEMKKDDGKDNLRAVWVPTPEFILPDERNLKRYVALGWEPEETQPDYVTNLTPINLTDFIWLCCQHHSVCKKDMRFEMIGIILYPFHYAVLADKSSWVPKTASRLKKVRKALKNIKMN